MAGSLPRAEEAEECGVIGQTTRGRELQPVQRDMGGVEVDGVDVGGVGGQIAQHIAAARGDRDDPGLGAISSASMSTTGSSQIWA